MLAPHQGLLKIFELYFSNLPALLNEQIEITERPIWLPLVLHIEVERVTRLELATFSLGS
jgi:hypothetical protein